MPSVLLKISNYNSMS